MTTRPNPDSLPEGQARQVLGRAAQLDESVRLHVSIADLRIAALEAGISERSLEQALAELRPVELPAPEQSAAEAPPPGRGRRWLIFAATALVVALGATAAVRVLTTPGDLEIILHEEPATMGVLPFERPAEVPAAPGR